MKKLLLLFTMLLLSNTNFGQVALSENFDGTTFPPTDWTVVNTHATNNWKRTPTAITGFGSATVAWIAAPQDESLISPVFNLVGMNTATLNFSVTLGYLYMVTNPVGDFTASISNDGGISWNQLWVEEDYGAYVEYVPLNISINLANYVGQTNLQIKFQYVGNDADTVRLDDVSVSSCANADQPTITTLLDDSATLTWGGTASSYDFEWGPAGFIQGAGTMSNITDITTTLSGLTAGTGYTYFIRPNCGGASVAPWQGPFVFYTTLSTTTDIDYAYGFESGTFGSAGWTSPTAATGANWNLLGGSTFAQAGTRFAACGVNGAVSNAWLFSRGMNLVAGLPYTIKYYVRKYNAAGTSTIEKMKLTIGTTATSVGQTVLATSAAITNTTYALKTSTYTPTTSGVYYLGFNYYSAAQTAAANGYLFVDSVTVTTPLAVNTEKTNVFSISPNPATDVISVSNAANVILKNITISDINGRVVRNVAYENVGNVDLKISDLAAGMYIINIASDKGVETKKFMKN